MHEPQNEERKHMWSPPSQRSSVGNPADQRVFNKDGRALNVGDCALFQAGSDQPFIGILRKVTSEAVDQVKLTVNWLYREKDLKLAKGSVLEAEPNEIFYSFHRDVIPETTLLHPCKVAFLREGIELPAGVSFGFICRRVYDTTNRRLYWLSDQDYTNEHQEEVDELLDRTKLEMQAATQAGGPSPRNLSGSTTVQLLKGVSESAQNGSYSAAGKCKKRERSDQNVDLTKRERNVKLEDAEGSPLKRERSMKPEEIISNLDKDGGLADLTGVECLVQLMQQDQNDGNKKVADISGRRTKLANIIAATEKDECLSLFLHLGGLRLLDEWLQEAHKGKAGDAGSPREGDKGVEELLLGLLRALDKLPVDLKALKTCVVGKSVNHLRGHKNLEIQKKARKLVDVWKKRVDTEMKLSGESKPGGGNGIWSYKLSQSEPVHTSSGKDSGVPLEGTVKNAAATSGNTKPVQNGPVNGDSSAKTTEGSGKAGSPLLPAVKDTSAKLPAGNYGSDVHADMAKEEKSSCSSHSLSNGHSLASGVEKGAATVWKDEAKNGVVIPGKGGSGGTGLPSLGQPGANPPGGYKETSSDKAAVWNKNSATEKVGSPVGGAEKDVESGGSQQRLIVRIPNSARSPAPSSGGAGEGHVSRSSSPSASERQTPANFDKSQQVEAAENPNSSARPSRSTPMDTTEGAMGLLATVAAAAEESGGEFFHTVDSTGQADMRVDPTAQRTKHEETGVLQSFAEHEPSPSVGHGDGKSDRKEQQVTSHTLEQSAGTEKSAERHNLRRDSANGEGLRMDNVNAKLTVEHPYLKEHKVKDINDLESKPIGFDGQLSIKFGTRTGERGLSRTHSKVAKSAIELCNGIGLGDYRSSFGVPSVEHLMDERPGRKRGQEVGQLFGRRGDSDVHRIADLGFPEEDVLEVARQAADEVEQMEKYGKPVSSSLLDRDAHETRPVGISPGTETRESSVGDAPGRDRISSVVLDNVKNTKTIPQDQRYSDRNVRMHFDDTREDTEQRKGEVAEAAVGSGLVEGHELDAPNAGQRSVTAPSSSPKAQESHMALENSQQDSRGVNPNTPQQAGESCGPSETGVGGSEVAERPVFDLNEGFTGEDSPQNDATTLTVSMPPILVHPIASGASASGVAAPIAVLAATKGAFIPPASPLRNKGDHCWKGSAATSAFRPAEPRRTPERLNSNGESIASDANLAMTTIMQKRARPLLEFDLNVADERVTHEAGISATTLSSQGSVLGMSLHSNSVPSSLVSGLTCVKPESSRVASLKPESSSSAYPLSNGGSGPLRSSQGQAPPANGQGSMRPTLDLDLNRMDDSEENCVPLFVDPRGTMEGLGSSARSNNSTTQPQSQPPPQPARRPMDFDLNDGPSLEESGGEETAVHPFMSRKPPAGNVGPSAMTLTGLRMGGDTMSLSPWTFSAGPGNGNPGGALPPFLSSRPLDSGYSVANAVVPHPFLNTNTGAGPPSAPAPGGGGASGEMFGAGGLGSATPAVVYPGSERMPFGVSYGPYSMFGNSPSFHPSSTAFPATSMPFGEMPNLLPIPSMGSQPLVNPGTMTSSYLMGMAEMGPMTNVGTDHGWSRLSLDLNSGPEAGESESTREEGMHGRLPPLHPGAPAFTDLSATLAQVANNPGLPPAVKRKEPEGGWNLHSGVGIYKQSTWR
ncbi:uncharacterized protein [Physcomitrium patens]|uniref:BAH domain-containing protein n=2 Tax=Physcomitrium patens TaxID=3218 RepID=A0A2K1KA50_PHYPA|nr:uncharacterized protein LOC112284745 [Physcomitrium patens]PNR50639.1 hypothetical protein PHYPA_009825 [Physcomitrium patens]|eukprot:XP_024380672.1 uncharacterized protein LOC112284745 [Physcomitrella patens]